jgi:hypothetical protein
MQTFACPLLYLPAVAVLPIVGIVGGEVVNLARV